jgi:hypothetical protein
MINYSASHFEGSAWYFLCGNVLVIRSKYLPHTILLFDAFWQQFLHTIAALFCILYTLVGPWKQRHGEVPEKS